MKNPDLPLDDFTWDHAIDVVRRAQRAGKCPVEALHADGLLVTPARAKQMSLIAARELLDSLHGWSSVEMLRRVNRTVSSATPADMWEAFLSYIAEWVKHVEAR